LIAPALKATLPPKYPPPGAHWVRAEQNKTFWSTTQYREAAGGVHRGGRYLLVAPPLCRLLLGTFLADTRKVPSLVPFLLVFRNIYLFNRMIRWRMPPFFYPRATSSTIITVNPKQKAMTPISEWVFSFISGINASTTTYSMAPAAKHSR